MGEKKCMKCGEIKPLSDFYKHPQMADGHLNKCKECTKKDVHNNYVNKREQYQAYEHSEKRVESRRRRAGTYQKNHRAKNPEKNRARQILSYNLRKGYMTRPTVCSACGKECTPDAHHEDYSKPLDVTWLCRQCHIELHNERNLPCVS